MPSTGAEGRLGARGGPWQGLGCKRARFRSSSARPTLAFALELRHGWRAKIQDRLAGLLYLL